MSDYDGKIELMGEAGVLAVVGEIDPQTAPQFRRDLCEAMEVTSGDVGLDLSGLERVDSTALGSMIAAAGRMMTERRSLVLVVTSSRLLRAFSITGLLGFFSIVTTRSAAMARASCGGASTRLNCESEGGVTWCSGSCS